MADKNPVWRQIEGQLLWKNEDTGEYIMVSGSRDQQFYVVKHTFPDKSGSAFGRIMKTMQVSPYYVSNIKKPVGDYARTTQNQVKMYEDWVFSPKPMSDAVRAAFGYMRKNEKKR